MLGKTMKKNVFVMCIIIFMLCMLVEPGTANLQVSSIAEKNITLSLYSGDLKTDNYSHNALIDKSNLTEGQKKLSTALLMQTSASTLATPQIQGTYESSLRIKNIPVNSGSGGSPSASRNLPSGKLVYVYVYMNPGYSTHIINSSVYEVSNRDEDFHVAVAWVDVQNLETLASIDGIRTIQEVVPPVVSTGSVTTQGDTIHKTADVRTTYGNRGAGMKIGIISDGVDNIVSSQASGDLPADVTVLNNTQGGDEGTAMLEIVHDMVPDAKLYFHDCGENIIAFNAAIDVLAANGCTVICDDIGWLSEPFFEDGIIASHVGTLLSGNKIIYVSAAGNSAISHYQGEFYDGSSGNHDFSSGTNATYKRLYIEIPPGESVTIILQWNDQFGYSGNDYDLALSQTSYGDLGQSERMQSGTQDPFEYISYTNTGSSSVTAQIGVYKYAGSSKTLELYTMTSSSAFLYANNRVAADSIFGQPAVPDVIAVAAVPASSPSTIEAFSSRGPVTITYPSPETRQKPDISAVDGVAITGAGGFSNPFYGTSASAPHIAAIVAQYWGAHPTMTPAQVRNALYISAVDLGTSGKDTIFGYGRADAAAMALIGDGGGGSNKAVVVKQFQFGKSGDTPVLGNWNGDSSADTGVFRESTGNWYLDTTNTGVVNKSFQFGKSGDNPVVGDWNGDSAFDAGVFRPATGMWYLDITKTGVVSSSFQFGKSGDTPVVGDWNGNGVYDSGVFRPATGTWYLDTTKTGVVNKTFQFGKSGDTPVVGDWNGNGNFDSGVFRPATGMWYQDTTKSGVVSSSFQFGKSGDSPRVGEWI